MFSSAHQANSQYHGGIAVTGKQILADALINNGDPFRAPTLDYVTTGDPLRRDIAWDLFLGQDLIVAQAIASLIREHIPVDIITVAMRLKTTDMLREIGGGNYLTELATIDTGPKGKPEWM